MTGFEGMAARDGRGRCDPHTLAHRSEKNEDTVCGVMKMSEENHIRNAGRSLAKGAKNAAGAVAEGRLAEGAESAWEGAATAAREAGRSVGDATRRVIGADGRDAAEREDPERTNPDR